MTEIAEVAAGEQRCRGPVPLLLGAGAGGLAALGAREAVLASPASLAGCGWRWSRCGAPGEEGYAPSTAGAPPARRARRRRGAARRLVPRRRRGRAAAGDRRPGARRAGRSRAAAPATARAVERALPEVATAVADSLGAGRSLRASLPAAAASLDGPPAVELARLGAELDLGAPTADAIGAWRRRMRSARVDAFAAALLSQRLAGGDLAGLLRRFADGAAERDRVAEDAKAATAQARFTGLLVVAMPSGGALFAELIQPGFLAKVLGAPASAVLLALAAALQVAGFVAIRRFSRVVE